MRLRVYKSVQALYGAANALYWKCLKRQNFTHLTLLKPQNTKTSLYKLSKNHWVIAFLKFLGPSEENYNPQSLWITLYIIYYLTILKVLCLHDINRLHVNSCYVRCSFGIWYFVVNTTTVLPHPSGSREIWVSFQKF